MDTFLVYTQVHAWRIEAPDKKIAQIAADMFEAGDYGLQDEIEKCCGVKLTGAWKKFPAPK